jgi:hypothetical protein
MYSTISSTGGKQAGSGYLLNCTAGEAMIGLNNATSYEEFIGFSNQY